MSMAAGISDAFFGTGFYTAGLMFLLISVLLYHMIMRDCLSRGDEPKKMYVCGNNADPDQYRITESSFYKTIISYFRLGRIKRAHTGYLSVYLLWTVIGLVILSFIL